MPQMAPLYWLYLFVFFIVSFFLFLSLNYFIKPFDKLDLTHSPQDLKFKIWKL
uniref:ATP synthase complex subunit 8 n=1 Tax=Grapsus albolineatus TaxID=156079 RepID=A0A890JKF5_9EUCA|nr:ATP synthase F0 subunit 8 [Grapsus albolineatus]QRH17763.1 ATP synthase F0 subunit 8 [Grapsus albolineatus]UBD09492.1 ATP synthase F0 subunit 8 [Grapsus albolineatus]UKS08541.1 ATP synthase F0 subunit 8 [Grapsus albolineatus]UYC29005.1 ATP synthase F0 subunit 8 [Grapsus albolineatus]